MKNQVIDFVITWVDGSDPIWFQEKQKIFKKRLARLIQTIVRNVTETGNSKVFISFDRKICSMGK